MDIATIANNYFSSIGLFQGIGIMVLVIAFALWVSSYPR